METASRLLQSKFDAARSIFAAAIAAGAAAETLQAFQAELCAVEIKLALMTGHLFVAVSAGESARIRAHADFARILAAEDFAGTVDRFVARAEEAMIEFGVALRDDSSDARRGKGAVRPRRGAAVKSRVPAGAVAAIQRLIDVYPRDSQGNLAAGSPQQLDYERCPACGGDMAVDASRSELRCCDSECGTIRELVGTVFDDSQFYSQEGQKAKSGTFNPNRHFQFWWMHILAREPEEEIGDKDDPNNMYGESLLAKLRAIVARDRKVLRLLTVNDVRAMLRETEHTELNKNVPLILKKLTGVGPPQVSDAIAVRVENLFTKAIEIGERVRRNGRINRNYYPFYIFKILEQLLDEKDFENRRVLYYIYIQSKETVEADDADWEQICAELAEISYVPTDRTLGLKYHPT
jgi:hypothetical protein